jgi:hypothetical protein
VTFFKRHPTINNQFCKENFMKTLSTTLKVLTCALFIMSLSSIAQAQAVRTWVSGVGDDVNPCSRTAPCKTFAGAISKTSVHGEINALDSGGYGAVTITKGIMIDGAGVHASILASSTTGVSINITTTDANDPHKKVALRNLSINGAGTCGSGCGTNTGIRGINVVGGLKQLYVENTNIANFTTSGIRVDFATPAGGTRISIKDTNINNIAGAATTNGIELNTSANFISGVIDNVRVEATGTGINVKDRANVAIRNTVIQNCTTAGAAINAPSNQAFMSLEDSYVLSCNIGVQAGNAGTTLDLSNTTIAGNSTAVGGGAGTRTSHGNNRIFGNTSAGLALTNAGEQ